MKEGGTDVPWCWTISFASNGPEGIKNSCQPGLYKAQGNLLSIAPLHFAHLSLPCKPTHHKTQIQEGLFTCSTEKQNLVGLTVSSLWKASLCNSQSSLQQLLGSPGEAWTCWRRKPKKTSSTPTHGLRMSLEKWQPESCILPCHSPTTSGRDLQLAPHWQPEPLVCSAQVQSLQSPGTRQLFFTWPFPFTGIQGGTAVLSVRKGRTIKPAKQHSKRVIPSSAPAWGLSTELLFRNFTKRKSESYFGCMAKKHPPFQRN